MSQSAQTYIDRGMLVGEVSFAWDMKGRQATDQAHESKTAVPLSRASVDHVVVSGLPSRPTTQLESLGSDNVSESIVVLDTLFGMPGTPFSPTRDALALPLHMNVLRSTAVVIPATLSLKMRKIRDAPAYDDSKCITPFPMPQPPATRVGAGCLRHTKKDIAAGSHSDEDVFGGTGTGQETQLRSDSAKDRDLGMATDEECVAHEPLAPTRIPARAETHTSPRPILRSVRRPIAISDEKMSAVKNADQTMAIGREGAVNGRGQREERIADGGGKLGTLGQKTTAAPSLRVDKGAGDASRVSRSLEGREGAAQRRTGVDASTTSTPVSAAAQMRKSRKAWLRSKTDDERRGHIAAFVGLLGNWAIETGRASRLRLAPLGRIKVPSGTIASTGRDSKAKLKARIAKRDSMKQAASDVIRSWSSCFDGVGYAGGALLVMPFPARLGLDIKLDSTDCSELESNLLAGTATSVSAAHIDYALAHYARSLDLSPYPIESKKSKKKRGKTRTVVVPGNAYDRPDSVAEAFRMLGRRSKDRNLRDVRRVLLRVDIGSRSTLRPVLVVLLADDDVVTEVHADVYAYLPMGNADDKRLRRFLATIIPTFDPTFATLILNDAFEGLENRDVFSVEAQGVLLLAVLGCIESPKQVLESEEDTMVTWAEVCDSWGIEADMETAENRVGLLENVVCNLFGSISDEVKNVNENYDLWKDDKL